MSAIPPNSAAPGERPAGKPIVQGEKLRGAEKMARIPIKIEATTAPLRKPTWIRAKSQGTPEVARIKDILRTAKLHTVCEEAACPNLGERSEEHTSELQSLMRISYAVFCLKKKKNKQNNNKTTPANDQQ